MLDIDLLVSAARSQRLGGPESFLQFFGKAVKIHKVPTS